MAIGTSYRLSAVGRWQGTLHVNTWWFLQVGNPSVLVPSMHLIERWQIEVMPFYRTLFQPQFNLFQLNVWVAKGSPENLSVDINVNGNASFGGTHMATQISMVTTWLTGIAGRRFRGRSYFGGLVTGIQVGQGFSPLYFDRVTQVAQRMVEAMDDDGVFNFVVFSKANMTTSRVTGWTLRNALYTQRRRTAAYGE